MITITPLVRSNNDTTACFDQIMPHLLSLCLRSFRMPKKFTSLLGILLEGAQYAIKITRRISEDKYRHTFHSPVFGSGQGSTASATGWGK